MSETDKILNDIRSYLRITAAASSRAIVAKILDTQEKAVVYSKLDGKTSQQKIADATGVPQRTIADWAEMFVKAGLASPPDEYHSSHRALFSLSELGIDLSVLRRRKKSEQPEQISSTLDSVSEGTKGGETSG